MHCGERARAYFDILHGIFVNNSDLEEALAHYSFRSTGGRIEGTFLCFRFNIPRWFASACESQSLSFNVRSTK